MRIAFEIDGMISTRSGSLTDFDEIAKQSVVEDARIILAELKSAGHQIVLYTHRDMSTAMATESWLAKNKIPYDSITFNRPHTVSVFFAPDVFKFTGWDKVREELIGNGAIKKKHEDTSSAQDGGAAKKDSSAGHQDSKNLDTKPGRAGSQGPSSGGAIQTLK